MPPFSTPARLTTVGILPSKARLKTGTKLVAALCLSLTLSACYDKEKRAEAYYQSGLELLAEGDQTRALLELKNVFKYNGFHKEARETYANVLLQQGDVAGAYSQMLRLVEQHPDTLAARQSLARMALDQGNWDEVLRHATSAIALSPEDQINRNLQLVMDYRVAVQGRDTARSADLATTAEIRLEQQPDSLMLRRMVIDHITQGPNPVEALPDLDLALALSPKNYDMNLLKLRLLTRAEDAAGVGAQLTHMVDLYPQAEELRTMLLRWYMSQDDHPGGLQFLRDQAGPDDGAVEGHMQVVQFLNATSGTPAARAELDRLIAANSDMESNRMAYATVLATMDFEAGQTQEAISALQTLLNEAEVSQQKNDIQALLARMLNAQQQGDQARVLVAEILERDATNVEALKLRAGWSIAADNTNDAILDLRSALNQAPRDATIMTLLAMAHERDGNQDLTGEQLANAVSASNSGAPESLRYAKFLLRQGRVQSAENVLTDSYRAYPGNADVLTALGEVLLQSRQWARANEVATVLGQSQDPIQRQRAERIRAAILLMQNRIEEGLNLLEDAASQDAEDVRPSLVVALTQIRAGKSAQARQFIDETLVNFPDSTALHLLSASLYAVMGEAGEAEQVYRALIDANPELEPPVRLFYGFLQGEGRAVDARTLLTQALERMPDSSTLLLFRAGELELDGDIDGTIGIYERLYENNSSDIIIANNLASMLVTYRSDTDSLDRAQTIARRLRGATLPHFQDTYGWIQFRRNDPEDALSYLEPAAKGLPNDPLVQYHLGMTYRALERTDDAIRQFERALELGEGRNLPQLGTAATHLQELRNPQQ